MDQQQTPRPQRSGMDSVRCSRCGESVREIPPTWIYSVENGVRRYFCEDCARANIRAIEGRLDSTWW
ncbi:hypothetical protein ACFVIM_23260 [Streptomyces sp. NPDC057638]|uniref:hypothetical protein n=1 Tax=Streptomyces sp. NPDC057638 TaxID=3346190 RepID=UPI0036858AE5